MKHKSDKSDIIINDKNENYPHRTLSSTKPTGNKGAKDHVSIPNKENGKTELKKPTGGFSGKVYDKFTHVSIKGALIIIAKDLSVETDEKGAFVVTGIKPGKYRITISEEGYVEQSRKDIVVPGITTKLDSFHLVPSCLSDEYPNDIIKEEESIDEELVEFAIEVPRYTEPPPSIPSEMTIRAPKSLDTEVKKEEKEVIKIVPQESDKKITVLSSDIAAVESIEAKKVVTDSGIRETIIKEIPIETPETDTNKKTFSALEKTVKRTEITHVTIDHVEKMEEASSDKNISISAKKIQSTLVSTDLVKTTMPAPEGKDVGGVSSVDTLPQMTFKTRTTEAVQPEEIPQELSTEEILLRSSLMPWLRRKLKREFKTDTFQKIFTEVSQEIILPKMHAANISLPNELAIISVEKIETPVMIINSIEAVEFLLDKMHFLETVISMPEEIAPGSVSLVNELPCISFETCPAEAIQFEEIPQKPYIQEGSVTPPIETVQIAASHEKVVEEVHQEEHLELSTEAAPEFIIQEMVVKKTHKEKRSNDVYLSDEIVFMPTPEETQPSAISTDSIDAVVSLPEEKDSTETVIPAEEIQTPVTTKDSTETTISIPEGKVITETLIPAPEEIIAREKSAIEELPVAPVEVIVTETIQPEKAQLEPTPNKSRSKLKWWLTRRKKTKETPQEKLLEPIVSEDTEQVISPEHQEQSIKSPVESIPQITVQKEVPNEAHNEVPPVESSAEEVVKHNSVDEVSAAPSKVLENASDHIIPSTSDQENEIKPHDEYNSMEVEGFMGSFNVQPNPAFKGLPITVTYRLRNITCDNPKDLFVQFTIVNPDTATVLEFFDEPIRCSKGTFSTGGFTFATKSYEADVYRINMDIFSYKTKKSHLIADTSLEIKNILF